jgi:hypothetical protein
MRIFLIAAALISTVVPGHANETVGEFVGFCNGNRGEAGQVVCRYFIGGVGRQMFFTGGFSKKLRTRAERETINAVAACTEVDVTDAAMVQVFKNWATAHPENWGMPAQVGINLALTQTWPCR